MARLWQEEHLDKTKTALQEANKILIETGGDAAEGPKFSATLVNNLGALLHMEGDAKEAQKMYEKALTDVTSASTEGGKASEEAEKTSPVILYNLARAYEDQGDESAAKGAYDKLLLRHPEYVDGAWGVFSLLP